MAENQHINWDQYLAEMIDSKGSIYDIGKAAVEAGKSVDMLTKEIEIMIKTSDTWKNYDSGQLYSECDFFSEYHNEYYKPIETARVIIEEKKPPQRVLNRFSFLEIE